LGKILGNTVGKILGILGKKLGKILGNTVRC
jgi:hypothetical protein